MIAVSYFVESIPNRNSPPAILIRKAWREGKRIRRQTVANITTLPPESVEGIRIILRGGVALPSLDLAFHIRQSCPTAMSPPSSASATASACTASCTAPPPAPAASPSLPSPHASSPLPPSSPPLAASALIPPPPASAPSSHSAPSPATKLLAMLDWLRQRQNWIQRSLARRHLAHSTLLLYDVTSAYVEGRCCPLAAFGYNRDGKKGKRQIVCGLLCAPDGCPVAVEVFRGNTADPATLGPQVHALRKRFGITRIALAGDRGMLTTARIREDLQPVGLDWISALKTKDIRPLLRPPNDGDGQAPLRPGELQDDQVAEILSPDFPGERLLVCLNPRLRAERARKREDLLQATERILEEIARQVRRKRKPLRGREAINRRVGREADRRKMAKHFTIEVEEADLRWSRREESIAEEARLDGIYIVRTSLSAEELGADEAVAAYKSLARVERAFRSLKTTQLQVRPMYVYSEEHVRGHVFLCMLAYYVEWHLRQKLAPLLFEDAEREAAQARRETPVEPAKVSEAAEAKAASKRTAEGLPVLVAVTNAEGSNDVGSAGGSRHGHRRFRDRDPFGGIATLTGGRQLRRVRLVVPDQEKWNLPAIPGATHWTWHRCQPTPTGTCWLIPAT